MKNLNILFFSFLFFSVSAFAQDENPTRKGRIIGEVDFGFDGLNVTQTHDTYVDDVTSKNSLFLVDMRIGYSVINNLVVSLAVGHDHQRQETITPDFVGLPGSGETTLNKTNGGFLGVGATYYFLNKQFKPFIGASIGRTHVNVELEGQGNTTELSGSGLGYTIDAGLAYFINDHVGFELRYVYYSAANDVTGGGNASGFEYDLAYNENLKINIVEFGFLIAF